MFVFSASFQCLSSRLSVYEVPAKSVWFALCHQFTNRIHNQLGLIKDFASPQTLLPPRTGKWLIKNLPLFPAICIAALFGGSRQFANQPPTEANDVLERPAINDRPIIPHPPPHASPTPPAITEGVGRRGGHPIPSPTRSQMWNLPLNQRRRSMVHGRKASPRAEAHKRQT